MAPDPGLEPGTKRLTVFCSTTELIRNWKIHFWRTQLHCSKRSAICCVVMLWATITLLLFAFSVSACMRPQAWGCLNFAWQQLCIRCRPDRADLCRALVWWTQTFFITTQQITLHWYYYSTNSDTGQLICCLYLNILAVLLLLKYHVVVQHKRLWQIVVQLLCGAAALLIIFYSNTLICI